MQNFSHMYFTSLMVLACSGRFLSNITLFFHAALSGKLVSKLGSKGKERLGGGGGGGQLLES